MSRRLEALSDVELLAKLSAGDVSAAGELYDRYAPLLLGLSLRIVRDRALAEDVVHDAFIAMSERAAQYSPDRGVVAAWLVTLVRNLSIDRARRRERRGVILKRAQGEPQVAVTLDPERLLSDATLHARVRRALAELPDVQRTTLEVAFFEGLSYPEIAERENVPLGTIKSRAARALASLRVALEAERASLGDGKPPGESD
jgi:RNA polymerase sigma-70 factor, ECF subfamily